MGGYIAQTLAVRQPQLVDRLVLVCTGSGGPDFEPSPEETTTVWLANAGRTPPEFARATMPLSFRPGWTDEHPDEFEQLLADRLEHPTPPESWRAQYEACLDWTARPTPVEQIESPTLVVHGNADRIVPYANGVELARASRARASSGSRAAGTSSSSSRPSASTRSSPSSSCDHARRGPARDRRGAAVR